MHYMERDLVSPDRSDLDGKRAGKAMTEIVTGIPNCSSCSLLSSEDKILPQWRKNSFSQPRKGLIINKQTNK